MLDFIEQGRFATEVDVCLQCFNAAINAHLVVLNKKKKKQNKEKNSHIFVSWRHPVYSQVRVAVHNMVLDPSRPIRTYGAN